MVQLVINMTFYRLALEEVAHYEHLHRRTYLYECGLTNRKKEKEVACDWSVQRSCDPLSFLSHTVALYMVSYTSVPLPV